jgi:[ribosomal protein S18]-alanine N-acetyltransferase
VLERAEPAHAEALAFLHARAFPTGERWNAATMALQLGQPGAFGWISAQGGMILARATADEAEVLTLAVDPERRRRGLGRRLIEHAIATAGDRGARCMFLEVGEGNAPARALYGAAGFTEVGRRRRYYRDGSDALLLRRAILCGPAAA